MTTIGIASLGCAKNLVDSEIILGILKKYGGTIVSELDKAEVIIINTCGFIAEAQQESIVTILKAVALKSSGCVKKIIVAGCLTQLFGNELRKQISEVDAWVGINDFPKINEILDKILEGEEVFKISSKPYIYDHTVPRLILTPPHYAYIKIAEGCDHLCSFCIIPNIKGKMRSRHPDSVIAEAESLISNGAKELILIAQDSTQYGKDIGIVNALAKLLKRLSAIKGNFWIRVLYTYSSYWTDELIEAFASEEKICKYVDIPIQHVNDEILKSMRRGENRSTIESLLSKLRKRIPGVFLRTSVIVGYPSETDNQFNELCEFLKEAKFERLGAFTYSPEKGSPAADIKSCVSEKVKEERYETIMQIQQRISLSNNSKLLGKTLQCIVDEESEKKNISPYIGRTYGDAPEVDGVVYLHGAGLKPGDFVTIKITDFEEYDLIGEVVR